MTGVRADLLHEMQFAVSHEPSIHYAQTRPIDVAGWKAHKLPWTGDCSGIIKAIGLACGLDFDGHGAYGYTGTLLAAGDPIRQEDVLVGDVGIFVGSDGDSTHAIMAMDEAGTHVMSHGQEAGPIRIGLALEKQAHSGQQLHWVRFVPGPVRWKVVAGNGSVLAREIAHPAVWAREHAHVFREREQVTFEKV